MRYTQIRTLDISNGEGVGVSLFTQGCPFHCKGCFNPETWNFDGGNEYTIETRDKIVDLCNRPQIKRFTILGGEPFLLKNKDELITLCSLIKEVKPDIKIWIYSGNTIENLKSDWFELLEIIDVLVDGQYIEEERDITLKWRGSRNQRILYKGKDF